MYQLLCLLQLFILYLAPIIIYQISIIILHKLQHTTVYQPEPRPSAPKALSTIIATVIFIHYLTSYSCNNIIISSIISDDAALVNLRRNTSTHNNLERIVPCLISKLRNK